MNKPFRILGVDPGTQILGYGILEIKDNQPNVIELSVLHLTSIESQQDKLKEIFLSIQELIEKFQPYALSIEAPFYGKNAQSMHKLGRAQGVAIAAAIVMGLEIYEFSPRKIKKSITGNGNASKEQVAGMLESILNFKINSKYFDASDALAAALCLSFQMKTAGKPKEVSTGWKRFIQKNPERVI